MYTAKDAEVAASLLQVCYLAVIKPIPGQVHIACSGLMIKTSLLQVVNRLDASRLSRLFTQKLDASCFNNLQRVSKYEVASSLIFTDSMQLMQAHEASTLDAASWQNCIKQVQSTICIKSVALLAVEVVQSIAPQRYRLFHYLNGKVKINISRNPLQTVRRQAFARKVEFRFTVSCTERSCTFCVLERDYPCYEQ